MEKELLLPNHKPFRFWNDQTRYRRTYHVANQHPRASDENPGSEEQPFRTIQRAAEALIPGERVVVHEGVYRECVRPARGGASPEEMIAYEAAPGELVQVRGSEAINGGFVPSEGWGGFPPEGALQIWTRQLPAEWFIGYNPLIANNLSAAFTTFNDDWKAEEILAQQLKRVHLYADGRALRQVHFFHQLGEQDGAFWVEDPGLCVHVRMWEDANPNGTHFEITTREQVFAPLNRGLGFIRVSGFHFEYAADGVPVPQRAMLSAARGHHWIIENNVLLGANSTAIDVGNESWHASKPKDGQPVGHHILRSNHIYDCGFCGIAGVGFVDGTLVEHNLIEHIGRDHIERVWESAGLKFHTTKDVVIRRNVFRHLRDACGVWLDYLNENTRVTENVFYDIEALHPAIYIEVSHTYNEVDHNVVWNIRKPHDRDAYRYGYASGIGADTGEKCIIAHNLIGEIHNLYAISADLVQAGRVVGGRVGLCRKHQIYNNLLFHCRKRVLLSRMEDNRCDGNVYDQDGDAKSFCVQYPAPEMVLDFDAWQEHCGMDEHGAQAALTVEFDPDTLEVIIDLPGKPPAAQRVPAVQSPAEPTPGPFVLLAGRNVYRMNAGLLKEE